MDKDYIEYQLHLIELMIYNTGFSNLSYKDYAILEAVNLIRKAMDKD